MTQSPEDVTPREIRCKGVGASHGVAIAPLITFARNEPIVRKRQIRADEIESEIRRLEQALTETKQQLQQIQSDLEKSSEKESGQVFDAHQLVVDDPMLLEAVKSQVHSRLLSVDYIYQQMARSFARKLREIEDTYLQERAIDIMDVARRVLRNLQGMSTSTVQPNLTPSIIFSRDLTPSDTATLDRNLVVGIVTETGSRTSHSAIMARSFNLPAIVALELPDDPWLEGVEALIDGYKGLLIINPSEETKREYSQIKTHHQELEVKLSALRDTKAITVDQHQVTLSANVEWPDDFPFVKSSGAEGIGLLRTEFLFLNRTELPSEEEQVKLYRQAAEAAKPHSVIIRTLDIGGDKTHAHLAIEEEANPFLGCRGIRYSLNQPQIFKTQLRALCRASVEGNVRLMFPMITEIGELRRSRQYLVEAQNELRQEQLAQADRIEVGMMIEVPSAALIADLFAQEVDFFSIGTNDLIQYTLAVDRGNDRVANLYQPTHPSVIRLILQVVEAAHRRNIWVGVCGEMASDPLLAPLLVGLGVDELSLSSLYVPRVKRAIQALQFSETQKLVQEMLNCPTAEENMRKLEEMAQRLYTDVL